MFRRGKHGRAGGCGLDTPRDPASTPHIFPPRAARRPAPARPASRVSSCSSRYRRVYTPTRYRPALGSTTVCPSGCFSRGTIVTWRGRGRGLEVCTPQKGAKWQGRRGAATHACHAALRHAPCQRAPAALRATHRQHRFQRGQQRDEQAGGRLHQRDAAARLGRKGRPLPPQLLHLQRLRGGGWEGEWCERVECMSAGRARWGTTAAETRRRQASASPQPAPTPPPAPTKPHQHPQTAASTHTSHQHPRAHTAPLTYLFHVSLLDLYTPVLRRHRGRRVDQIGQLRAAAAAAGREGRVAAGAVRRAECGASGGGE